jgi:hypothetical protein
MKQNLLAASLIFVCFTYLSSVPAIGCLIVLTTPRSSTSLVGPFLLLSSPLGMLAWAVIKKNEWNQSDSKLLQSWSVMNTVLLYVDLVALLATFFYSCCSEPGCSLG